MHEPQAVPLPLAIPAIERLQLMRYIERRISNPDDADDLVQEVLRRALQAKSAQLIEDPASLAMSSVTLRGSALSAPASSSIRTWQNPLPSTRWTQRLMPARPRRRLPRKSITNARSTRPSSTCRPLTGRCC